MYKLWGWDSEEERQEDLYNPEKNYTVQVNITGHVSTTTGSEDDSERLQKMAYSWLDEYKEDNSIDHPEEKDEAGLITKEAWKEEIYVFPYKDMIGCN